MTALSSTHLYRRSPRRFRLGTAAAIATAIAIAGSATAPPAAAREPTPPHGGVELGAELRDVTYCSNDGIDLKLDYFRADAAGTAPLLVFVHGGGWKSGDKGQLERLEAFEPLLQAGHNLASVNYRLSPEHPFPAPIIDVKCAVRYLRANAVDYGIDPGRIAVSGFSAGAHLAMLAGVTDPSAGFDVGQYDEVSSAVSAVIDLGGQVDITHLATTHPHAAESTFAGSTEVMVAASPTTHLDAADPPFLIIHGELDAVVPVEQAELLDGVLSDVGIEHSVIIIPGGEHELPSGPSNTAAMVGFLEDHLG